MRKFIFVLIILFATAGIFAVSTEDIQNAAATLNVPYDVLAELVAEYNEGTPAESASSSVVDLDTLYDDFIANGVAADMKYNGQEITVRFSVSSMHANSMYGEQYSWIDDSYPYRYQIEGPNGFSNDYSVFLYFSCYPDNAETGKLMNVKSGDYLTVQGTCSVETFGTLIYINLFGAKIL